MNIEQLIQDHKELKELPFLIVYRTMQVLNEMGLLNGVENAQPKS